MMLMFLRWSPEEHHDEPSDVQSNSLQTSPELTFLLVSLRTELEHNTGSLYELSAQ